MSESRLCLEDFLLTALSVLALSSKTTEVFLIEALDCFICVGLCCNTLDTREMRLDFCQIFVHKISTNLILKDFLNLENVAAEVTSWSSC